MAKIILFSHSGFSDENANGITMKNLLSAWPPEDKAEFYCDVQPPDLTAAHSYFRATDMDMMKSFLGKGGGRVFRYEPAAKCGDGAEGQRPRPGASARRIPAWLKKRKYNFGLKWLREWLRLTGTWGRKELLRWIDEVSPEALVYMVGESIFMDKLVLSVCRERNIPLVLYNGEAYRIIDISKRRGLERAYYRRVEKLYAELNGMAKLVIYNCGMLKDGYEAMYPVSGKPIICYNSAERGCSPYEPGGELRISYFGNLGVGRGESLLKVSEILERIDPTLVLDIYGNAAEELAERFYARPNISYHGFVDADTLHGIVERSDILLHVESFDEKIMPKLKYAFSTKIAQCLRSGRCFVTYAPAETASTRYLTVKGGAAVASSEQELEELLRRLVTEPELRREYAEIARAAGEKNHKMSVTAAYVREEIEALLEQA